MKKRYSLMFLGVVLFSAGAYALFNLTPAKKFRFNHNLHTASMGMSCDTCHSPDEKTAMMGYPSHEVCASCHAVDDKKNCKFCHINTKKPSKIHSGKILTDVHFRHEVHLSKKIPCEACHRDMTKVKNVQGSEAMPDMQTCLNCHKDKRAKNKENCSFCHPGSFTKEKPRTHTPLWIKKHGSSLSSYDQKKCRYCHNSSLAKDCLDCHKTQEPPSHTQTFKIRGHAQLSMLDRQSCMVCHEQQTCLLCHQKTRPFSHTGMYGSPYNRHCNHCHYSGNVSTVSGSGSNCFFCHKPAVANAVHLQKAILPVGHAKANCLSCHKWGGGTATPKMKHPGGGTDAFCLSCHH